MGEYARYSTLRNSHRPSILPPPPDAADNQRSPRGTPKANLPASVLRIAPPRHFSPAAQGPLTRGERLHLPLFKKDFTFFIITWGGILKSHKNKAALKLDSVHRGFQVAPHALASLPLSFFLFFQLLFLTFSFLSHLNKTLCNQDPFSPLALESSWPPGLSH